MWIVWLILGIIFVLGGIGGIIDEQQWLCRDYFVPTFCFIIAIICFCLI